MAHGEGKDGRHGMASKVAPFVPQNGLWTGADIDAHPRDAVAWARRERARWSERSQMNADMDSGWSKMEADLCRGGLAECDRVELAALRAIVADGAAENAAGN